MAWPERTGRFWYMCDISILVNHLCLKGYQAHSGFQEHPRAAQACCTWGWMRFKSTWICSSSPSPSPGGNPIKAQKQPACSVLLLFYCIWVSNARGRCQKAILLLDDLHAMFQDAAFWTTLPSGVPGPPNLYNIPRCSEVFYFCPNGFRLLFLPESQVSA